MFVEILSGYIPGLLYRKHRSYSELRPYEILLVTVIIKKNKFIIYSHRKTKKNS